MLDMKNLKCTKHRISLEHLGGESAHSSNWYCPECDKENEDEETWGKEQFPDAFQYFIVNYIDRPYERHIAVKKGDWLCYIHPDLRGYVRLYFNEKEATRIEDFGFEVEENIIDVTFNKTRSGKATYSNGEPRLWQGEYIFTLPLPDNKFFLEKITCD